MRSRQILLVLMLLLAFALPLIFWPPGRFLPPPTPQPQPIVIKSQGPSIERLEQLSHLVASRVYVSDVLVGEGKGARGVWLVFGDALISVDLSKSAIVEKNEAAQRATIRLPLPTVLQARVDAERTQTFEVKSTTWLPWKSDKDSLRDEVLAHAQRLVAHAAGSAENLRQAKASAETVIRGFYAEVGWQVTVTWDTGEKTGKTAK